MLLFSALLVGPDAAALAGPDDSEESSDDGFGANEDNTGVDVPSEPDPSPAPDASTTAEVDVPMPGAEDPPAGEATEPNREVSADSDFAPNRVAARPHPYDVVTQQPCGEWRYFDFDAAYNLLLFIPPVCDEPLTCASERIDDGYFGRISGVDTRGVYGEYIDEIVSSAAGVGGGVVDVDIDGTNTSVLASGLGDRPGNLSLATFNWCRNDLGDFERTDPTWQVSFAWDTDFDAEYDRGAILVGLFQQLKAQLDLYNPEIAAAPPVSVGHTYVKFPTWLWIDEPLESFTVSSQNSGVENVQVSLRATLTEVSFHLDDTSITCDLADLVPYVDGETDPIEDVGPCHHVFEKVSDFDLSATLTYEIEERIRQRVHRSHAWPAAPWVAHDANQTLSLNPSAGRYEVHELLSLNVNRELELASD